MEAKEREAVLGDTDDDPDFKVSTAYLHAYRSPSSTEKHEESLLEYPSSCVA